MSDKEEPDYTEMLRKMRQGNYQPKEIPKKGKIDYLPFGINPAWALFVLAVTFFFERWSGLMLLIIWMAWYIGWNYIVKPRL